MKYYISDIKYFIVYLISLWLTREPLEWPPLASAQYNLSIFPAPKKSRVSVLVISCCKNVNILPSSLLPDIFCRWEY